MIRRPDPAFDRGLPPRNGRYSSAQAMRLLAHCYFRDAHTALDLTFGPALLEGTTPAGPSTSLGTTSTRKKPR